jgi:nitrogenase molybdenum-iron protein alpha/beta subunit
MAGTSFFTEGSSVFGGQSNLLAAITPDLRRYRQDLAGKRAAVYTGGAFNAFSLVRSLRTLGMKTVLAGSQGCATYIRRYMISHFKEPIDIASFSFGETSAIYGGRDNLRQGLENVARQY